jgi:hypothetical protein
VDDKKDILEEFTAAVNNIPGDIVVQRPFKQHPVLNSVNSSSVNTIRILSLLRNDGVKIYSCILRMGVNGAKVDNASSGGITCGIQDDGRLKSVAYSLKGDKYLVHPSSKVKFSDIVIPSFEEAKNIVKKLHVTIPHFRLVSWDIVIDESGAPTLLEANLKYGGIEVHQLNNGPLFGEDTEKILQEVFGKK